jgi:PfaD family protein
VARRFLEPAPGEILDALVRDGLLREEEARLARAVPVSEDLTVEADSGGHTDNQSFPALLPTLLRLRDRVAPGARMGAAGGLGTPQAVAGAFTMGAAWVLTGSVNQSAVESGLHEDGRRLLAQAALDDVMMAPAADMFEMGANVQVLRRGTLFGVRARKLMALYRQYDALEALPEAEVSRLEREVFLMRLAQAWAETRAWWMGRDPAEVERAERDPKHRMALVFRSYLGQASRWAIQGDTRRRMDHQIWCGPAMGSFNAWVEGSFLAPPEARTVAQIARNLLEGAAVVTRAQQLRCAGAPMPASAFDFRPRPLE